MLQLSNKRGFLKPKIRYLFYKIQKSTKPDPSAIDNEQIRANKLIIEFDERKKRRERGIMYDVNIMDSREGFPFILKKYSHKLSFRHFSQMELYWRAAVEG